MSGGGNVPYHLRQNKAIDRNLFVELLSRINLVKDIEAYTYISFGGSFLEDFKLIHSITGISKMISLEVDENIRNRQKFNMPLNCIEPRHLTSGEFLENHTFEGENIVWFDYASPKEIEQQLDETQYLITQLHDFDIVKITLNANANSLADHQTLEITKAKRSLKSKEESLKNCENSLKESAMSLKEAKNRNEDLMTAAAEEEKVKSSNFEAETEQNQHRLKKANQIVAPVRQSGLVVLPNELNDLRLEKLKERTGKHFLEEIETTDMKQVHYPNALCKVLKIAIQKAMDSKPKSYFQPLTAFSYADSSHTMLTYTGIILPSDDKKIKDFFDGTRLKAWDLFQPDGDRSIEISIPALSLKERMTIDSLLPLTDATRIQASLGFFVEGFDETSSIKSLSQYIKYYRQYPQFLKVSI